MVCLNMNPGLTYTALCAFQVTNRVERTCPRISYCAADSGHWKPCCDLLDLVVGCPIPLWTVALFKESFVTFNVVFLGCFVLVLSLIHI